MSMSPENRALVEQVVGSWHTIENQYGVVNIILPEATIERLLIAARQDPRPALGAEVGEVVGHDPEPANTMREAELIFQRDAALARAEAAEANLQLAVEALEKARVAVLLYSPDPTEPLDEIDAALAKIKAQHPAIPGEDFSSLQPQEEAFAPGSDEAANG